MIEVVHIAAAINPVQDGFDDCSGNLILDVDNAQAGDGTEISTSG